MIYLSKSPVGELFIGGTKIIVALSIIINLFLFSLFPHGYRYSNNIVMAIELSFYNSLCFFYVLFKYRFGPCYSTLLLHIVLLSEGDNNICCSLSLCITNPYHSFLLIYIKYKNKWFDIQNKQTDKEVIGYCNSNTESDIKRIKIIRII